MMARERERQVVDIHPHVAILVVITSLISWIYIFVVLGLGFNFVKDGRLMYISEGFQEQCGWTGVVLGTTGAVWALVQLLASIHMNSTLGIVSTAVQFVSWNLILGVSDTGWPLHYVALVCFFISMCWFHRMACLSAQYSSVCYYEHINMICIVVVVCFGVLFLTNGVGNFSSYHKKTIISVEVSMEFILLFLMMAQECCLAYGIARCTRLRIVFEDNPQSLD